MEHSAAERKKILASCLFWTYLFGLAAHAYMFFSGAFSHDALQQIITTDNEMQISLGRYLQPVLRLFRGLVNAPWLLGILELFFIALSAYLVIRLLKLRGLGVPLMCAIFSTNLVVTLLNASFVPWVDLFMVALWLSVLAVYLLERYPKFGFLFGAVCVCSSLALYQSYIAVTVGLLMSLFVLKILEGQPAKAFLNFALKAAGMLLIGAALYIVSIKATLAICGISLADSYNTIAGVGDFSSVNIGALFLDTYAQFAKFFLRPSTYMNRWMVAINLAVLFLSFGSFLRILWAKKVRPVYWLWLIACLVLLPFGLNVVYFISKGGQHHLMVYSYFLVYPFALALFQRAKALSPEPARAWRKNVRRWGAVALFGILILNNVVYANGLYLYKDLQADATQSFATRVLDRIEQTEGYVPGQTPVAFIGTFQENPSIKRPSAFDRFVECGTNSNTSITYYETYNKYFSYVLFAQIRLVSEEAYDAAQSGPIAQELDVFPAADCIKMENGVLYVRLS